jgi:signal transduction histidine kinase
MEAAAELNFFTVLGSFIAIVFIIAVGVVLLNLQFQKNMFRQQLANEELKSKHQLDLLQSSIAVQEGERKRIAENLHDELGAILSISRMRMLQFESSTIQLDEHQRQTLTDIRSYIETSIASMRRISHELIPPQLEQFGLVKTLESITYELSKTNNISVTFTSNQEISTLPWPVQIGLFRVVMELINNTIKHAQATEVHIDLSEDGNTLKCLYRDNGVGFSDKIESKGLGLKNIEGRVKALEGNIITNSRPSMGFTVSIQIPIRNAN